MTVDPHAPVSLRDRVAVVTGAGRGIGRAIASTLAAAEARVGLVARSAAELAETVQSIEAAGGTARAFPAGVAAPESIVEALQAIERALGPIDLLINNAGSIQPFGPFWETSVDEWWHTMEVNVRGPALCTRAVMGGMIARRRGCIVNVASGAGTSSMPYYSAYVASKTALIRMTECLALEARGCGVALFAMSPGTVRTRMTEYSLYSPEGQHWLPWFRAIFDQNIDVPLDRPAALALQLASGRYDALSGRFISVYDDLDALLAQAGTIEAENLYALTMAKLPGSGNPALNALLTAARRTERR